MTEKRFTICIDSNNLKSLWDDERTEEEPLLWLTRSDRIGGIDNVCELSNELNDENKKLKKENKQLKADNNRLVNETAKVVAEHQRKVLDLIDEKIKEYQKYDGYDTEKYYIGTQLLNELKKELVE